MDGKRDGQNRGRRARGNGSIRGDTRLLHMRLRDARPLELHAHVSRVACCAVVADVATMASQRRSSTGASFTDQLCIVSGDAVVKPASRPRRRPDVKFRGAHRGSINCMLQLRGTPLVLTGGDDGAVRLWNMREDLVRQSNLHCVQEFLFHSSCVLACAADPSQTFFATTGLDGIVALWLRDTPIPLLTITIGEPCSAVAILPEDPSLIRVAHQEQISVWDIRAQPHYVHFQRALAHQVRMRLENHTVTHDSERLQSIFRDQDTFTWIKDSGSMERCLTRMKVSGSPPQTMAHQFDEVSQRYVKAFASHHVGSRLLATTSVFEGQAVLTSASDYTHKLWNCTTSKGIASFQYSASNHRSATPTTTDLTPAGMLCHAQRFLYGADGTGGVHVWDLRASIASLTRPSDGVVLPSHSIHGHAFFVTSIALSLDDTVLATGDASGKILLRVASA